VPLEVNIHPYYMVESLPYRNADLFMLLRALPMLQEIVEEHNRKPGVYRTHLFLGIVFFPQSPKKESDFETPEQVEQIQAMVDHFNRVGSLPRALPSPPEVF
jgi:hypothetical protein